MLKRVTIVGERTAGHQHSGAFRRIDDHFGMGIQETPPPDTLRRDGSSSVSSPTSRCREPTP